MREPRGAGHWRQRLIANRALLSSDQTRFFKPFFPAITNLKMSTTDSGHYHPLHLVGMAVTPDGYLQLGDNAKDVAFVSRCLAHLNDRLPFDEADKGGFAAVADILERSLASQYLGTEVRYEETGYDDFGPRGETREVAVYSDRGNELIELQYLFEKFLNVRDNLLDQVAAHRSLVKIMSA